MFDRYLIEIDDGEAGLLLRQGAGFVFHALDRRFRALEGATFPDPGAAERALRRAAARLVRDRAA